MNQEPGRPLLFLLLPLLLFAFALRVWRLDAQSIWWDEGISLHLASIGIPAIVADRINNIHPPLYFFLLKMWTALAGLSLFSARYLSVLAAWLQVAALYALAARWFNRRTALLGALFVALSAVSIVYAQEARVYALLALAYLALLAIGHELIYRRPKGAGWWVALGAVSWTAIHLHYVALFAVVYVSAWTLLAFIRAGRRRDVRRLVLTQAIVFLAALPWFVAAVANWRVISGEASAGTFATEAVSGAYLLAQVWAFHLTGLAGALSRQTLVILVGAVAVLLIVLSALRLGARRTRPDTLMLLANWLIPLCSVLLVWLVRSFSHPRYVAMFVPGLFLLAAYLILPGVQAPDGGWRRAASRVLAPLLAGLLLVTSIWAAAVYFFDPGAAKDDIRGAAARLEELAGPDDLILVPDTDWSLPFAYDGPATVAMPGLDAGSDSWEQLARLTAQTPRVFTLDYRRGTRDWQQRLPFALHLAGSETDRSELNDLVILAYTLDKPVSAPILEPASANFGPLSLEGAWIEQGAPAGDEAAIALRWRVEQEQEEPAMIALRLLDSSGLDIAREDDRLVDAAGRPSQQWPVDSFVTTYHLLPLPLGTPPLTYSLTTELYTAADGQIRPYDLLDELGAPQGRAYSVGDLSTTRGLPLPAQDGDELAPGLVLLEATQPAEVVAPGSTLAVELLWQATLPLADLRPQLQLLQREKQIAVSGDAPGNGRYPTSEWQVGELVRERRQLRIPAEAAGEVSLSLSLNDTTFDLGSLTISTQAHVFDPPPMAQQMSASFGELGRLVGFDLPQGPFSAAEAVPLVLYWQALESGSSTSYAVFAHLLDQDGRLIGQHDGVPAQGERPTTSWVAGEYLTDAHDLIFRDPSYSGRTTVAVGLYDPVTGERVTLSDGSDQLILPVTLSITPTSEK